MHERAYTRAPSEAPPREGNGSPGLHRNDDGMNAETNSPVEVQGAGA